MLDTGLARPPSPTYTAITPVTRAPERNAPAANTELPAEDTVRPSVETSGGRRAADNGRNGQEQTDPVTPRVERHNVLDPESESLVYVARNTETGHVVRQIPSETLLRLRAYAKSVEDQQPKTEQQPFQRIA
ncbi:hypothetical protein [Roseibium salinum]|uniref:Flagellar protein FlaG n=1 Tax=Roseibium salinum TaxID=1604349 RepID=A0ABT3QYM4_9HYPH|nr:hypothetical protein [Roseibium sp. DSM 29163]MCX2722049.1 hypothetical protein [Roseibium sp. DSM 29163]